MKLKVSICLGMAIILLCVKAAATPDVIIAPTQGSKRKEDGRKDPSIFFFISGAGGISLGFSA